MNRPHSPEHRAARLKAITTHGMSYTATYRSWCSMIQRCTNPKSARFSRYGERGIKICARWQAFENFLADMGERPMGHSLDRIDNNGDYTKSNCRWATPHQQNRNMTNNRFITVNGKTMCATDWEIKLGSTSGRISTLIKRGTVETREEAVRYLMQRHRAKLEDGQ